ncbi:Transporter, LysE family [Sulfitobacter noctilucicola]|uniref:Threonine/homoserine/homoserine lactone efflux protein n=1 Tax=Sulfitobacter noctilucicola TaxID=1342301 RepID=A0A7W6MDF3_9RHOB|nr:LysE family translocator [Sulfitobacter noctilucicola]KIN70176.1 Transporter, LysE family [Sulfitobacter noctilucicola]MBB4176177.1 threonine/homoserine/homoserine lactone efflux protein [Sulfitobacter noctilucicola]
MIEFVIAVFFLLITPGPGVLTTAGIGAAFGFRAGFRFVAGLCLGGFITMMMVVSGLAAVVFAVPSLRTVLLFASVAYLVYLACRIASAGSKIGFAPAEAPLGFRNGLALQFINPKAYVVATTLFSGFAFLPHSPLLEVVAKLVLFNLIWVPVHLIWLAAGARVRRMNLSQRTQQVINIGMAVSLLLVVCVALLASG